MAKSPNVKQKKPRRRPVSLTSLSELLERNFHRLHKAIPLSMICAVHLVLLSKVGRSDRTLMAFPSRYCTSFPYHIRRELKAGSGWNGEELPKERNTDILG